MVFVFISPFLEWGKSLGLRSEVVVGPEDGFSVDRAIRCDFLTLIMKDKLTHFAGAWSPEKQQELNRALSYALQLPQPVK
jgi:hypothetical protein